MLLQSVENLRRFHRGRRRLKAMLLAVMAGLANPFEEERVAPEKIPQRRVSGSLRGRDSPAVPAEFLGSRRAAIRILDPDNKGFMTITDVTTALESLGEDVSELEVFEMLKSGDGDPNANNQTITHQQLYKLLPPLCPSKIYRRGELLYSEGDVDNTFYLLQKGEVLLRASSMQAGVRRDTPVAALQMGDSFGEIEMLLSRDGNVAPRAMACECLSPRCEVIAIEDFLFSLLTDVYGNVNTRLRKKAEHRCRKLVYNWAEGQQLGVRRGFKARNTIWSLDQVRKEGHKLIMIKKGFVEVEYRDSRAKKGVVKRYGPGSYLFTKDRMYGKELAREERCHKVRTLTDVEVMDVAESKYNDFVRNQRKQAIMDFLFEYQEEKGMVSVVTEWDDADKQQQLSAVVSTEAFGKKGNGLAHH